jgi:hypothetical protein
MPANVYLYHPVHGFKHASNPAEIAYDKSRGWHVHEELLRDAVAADVSGSGAAAPAASAAVEPEVVTAILGDVDAVPDSGTVRRGRRRLEKVVPDASDGSPTDNGLA